MSLLTQFYPGPGGGGGLAGIPGEVLVVGGGGGGGGTTSTASQPGFGGGGAQVIYMNTYIPTDFTIPIVIAGGGGYSSFGSMNAAPGGVGGFKSGVGGNGGFGSGGGSSTLTTSFGNILSGSGLETWFSSASTGGPGNDGGSANVPNLILGSPGTWGAGAGTWGGSTSPQTVPGGAPNTGNGGPGCPAWNNASYVNGGPGGSGVVIVAYPDSFPVPTIITGTYTQPARAGYRVYQFNGSGSIQLTF